MQGQASISGVVSGMRTDEIIAKIMELERRPITRLEASKSSLNLKIASWQEMNTRINALKSKADALSNPAVFDAKTFSTSEEGILTGSVSSNAQAGTYYLRVTQLATTHQMKADGYADTDMTAVGTGTINITVGSGTTKSITIDSSNNTLRGVRDAINKAGAGVTASIIHDGSSDNPYRLIITSNTSGLDGQVTFDADLSDGIGLNTTEMQAAKNASVTLGSGEGAIVISSSSNSVSTIIPGVTLNLREANADRPVTVTIRNDTESIKQAIQEFVDQYNNLIDFIDTQFKFNTETKATGALFGDSHLRAILSDLRSKIANPITGLDQPLKLLSQIGITSNTENKLVIDKADLDKALSANMEELKRLFTTSGETSSNKITYLSSGVGTKPSGPEGYEIVITTPATQARVTAGVAQAGTLLTDETITINGVSVELSAGMDQAQVITRINEYRDKTGVTASATDISGEGSGNFLTLTRIAYGSGAPISVISNVSNGGQHSADHSSGIGTRLVTIADPIGESNSGTGADGTDIEGTIGGEEATGSGQVLTGKADNPNTAGLILRISADAPGSYGTVVLSKGVGSVIGDYASQITDTKTGAVSNAQTGLKDQLTLINNRIKDIESQIAAKEDRLLVQFAAMESAMNKLQSQGAFLTQQIQQAQKNWK